jgi:N-methylhydantoinase A
MLQTDGVTQKGFILGIDVGGTFTDLVLIRANDGRTFFHKTPSTPADPSLAMERGIMEILAAAEGAPADVHYFGHGTTVATNALIEGKTAPTALVTTAGFRDILEIRRQRQPHNYNIRIPKPAAPVPRHLRREIAERIFLMGRENIPPSQNDLAPHIADFKAAKVAAIAVVFLHSYHDPSHERQVVEWLREALPGIFICASHEVLAEFREYERTSTTVLNAGLGPVMSRYLDMLERRVAALKLGASPHIQQSNGGFASPHDAGHRPISTLVSGPAAGVTGAVHLTKTAGFPDVITFDVGGTSTDVCVIQNSSPSIAREREVGGFAVRFPMIDVHSVGAGGGSIAWIDDGGFLQVGPKSAGADPGPACYDRGGTLPTVTDANVVLGRLNPIALLNGRMPINAELARAAIEEKIARPLNLTAEAAAEGILTILNETMVRAIRVITVEQGNDPRRFALLAFGGAGPLLSAPLARELSMKTTIVPAGPGLLCALGLLMADARRDFSVTRILPLNTDAGGALETTAQRLQAEADAWFAGEGEFGSGHALDWAADTRYLGQSHELTIPLRHGPFNDNAINDLIEDFGREHQRLYGYGADAGTELVTLRLTARSTVNRPEMNYSVNDAEQALQKIKGRRPVHFSGRGFVNCPVYNRAALVAGERIQGPAIIEQMDSTSVIFPDQQVECDTFGNMIVNFL